MEGVDGGRRPVSGAGPFAPLPPGRRLPGRLHPEGLQVPQQGALPRPRLDLEERVLRRTVDRVDAPAGAGDHTVGAGARAPATDRPVAVVDDLQSGVVQDVDVVA